MDEQAQGLYLGNNIIYHSHLFIDCYIRMENYINHKDRNYPVYVLSGLFIVPFPLTTL